MKKRDYIYEVLHDTRNTLSSYYGRHPNNISSPCYGAPWHFHRAIEMTYVMEGTIKCYVGNEEIFAEKDEIIFVPPWLLHTYLLFPDSSYIALIISDKIWEDFREYFPNATFPSLLAEKSFNRKLLPIWKKANEQKRSNDLVKKGITDIILGKLAECYRTDETILYANSNMITNALNYIEEHFTESISLERISDIFGYNKSYFSRVFHDYTGENIKNYINMLRVRYVRAQLKRYPETPITKIIFDAGFNSTSTFYRACKRLHDAYAKDLLSERKDRKTP